MKPTIFLVLTVFASLLVRAQKLETVYLNPGDTTQNMYIAVVPEGRPVTSLLFLVDGFGASPRDVLVQTTLPMVAAKAGMLTILPILKTGPLFFGTDNASQASLKEMIEGVVSKYGLQGKDFYIGGFSIGGSCVVKYAEGAVRDNYPVKPKAVFAVDPPLDWERVYKAHKRVVRLTRSGPVNGEVTYMIGRIEKEMDGTPDKALDHYHALSPYSYSDTSQWAIKPLVNTPITIFCEPDIQWWLSQRGFDLSSMNITDHVAMINELQRMGNRNAVLVTTTDKGYRQPGNKRHPHSWSIADPERVVGWLMSKK
jgi:hypothetical protein